METEVSVVPERELFTPGMEGLQGRMLLFDQDVHSLTPDEDVTYDVTADQLGSHEFRNYAVFSFASTSERVDFWADKDTGTDSKYKAWEKEMIRIVGANTKQAQELASLNTQLGIDFEKFDEAAARSVYERYFKSKDQERIRVNGGEVYVPSNVKQFVSDALAAFTDSTTNTVDYARLKAHLSSLQWFANVFGANSSEIVSQLIDAEAQLKTDAAPLVAAANQTETITESDGTTKEVKRLNKPRLKKREEELIDFLDVQLARIHVAPPAKPKAGEYTWHYHRSVKADKLFPYRDYARSLLAPMKVATELQRKFPDQYGSQSILALAQEVQADQEAIHRRYDRAHIDGIMRESLTDYVTFLNKKYGVSEFYDFSALDVQLIGGKAAQLNKDALGFMVAGAPSIYLNMDYIERIAQREKIDLQIDPQTAIKRILNEVIPHEYTHIIGEQAHWYLLKQREERDYSLDELRRAPDVTIGKLGSMLSKPTGTLNAYDVPGEKSERGRWIMEATTVELTEDWANQSEIQISQHVNAYPNERVVLDELITKLLQDGEIESRDEGFRYFVDAYFKEGGFLKLVRKLDGAGIDGKHERKRPHFTQTLYALMEYEQEQNTGTQYDLSRAFIGGSLTPVQRGLLKRAILASSPARLSQAARAYLGRKFELDLPIPVIRRKDERDEQIAA